jgi:PAS domain S-box-containing protein
MAYRFTFYVILLSFLLISFTTFLQQSIYYEIEKNRLEQLIEQLHETYLNIFNHRLEHEHEEQDRLFLEHFLKTTKLQYISVNVHEKTIATYGQLPPSNRLISKNFTLFSPAETSKPIGTLTVVASLEEIDRHFQQNWLVNLLINLMMAGFIAFFILWFFHRLMVNRCQQLADYVMKIESETLPIDSKQLIGTKPDDCPISCEVEDNALKPVIEVINRMHFNLQQAYQCLQAHERDTQQLLSAASVGFALWRIDGTIEKVNLAFAQLIGYSIEKTQQLNYWRDIVLEKEAVAERERLKLLKVGERYGPWEKEFYHQDGYLVPVRLSAVIVEKSDEFYVWSQVENLTRQKWMEKELQQVKQKEEETRSAKTQFLANMGHELRTPLSTIVGYSEILEDEVRDCCDRPALLEDLKKIHLAAKDLLSLIDGILDISKIEAGKIQLYVESFNLNTMIQNVVSTIHPLMENKANRLEVSYENSLGEVQTDLTKLRQILLNLLSNASKFTEQGLITLTVSRQQKTDGDWLYLRITDDGIGMTKEQQANLFQLFAQAETTITRKYGGIGLGLAMTKHLVEMLSGRIQVESEFGKGSQFEITLPANLQVEKKPAKTKSMTIRMPELPTEAGVLLVIDDDESVRHLLETYLSKVGYQVAVATNGPEGIKLAKKLHPHAITLDVMMPGMDGWEVLSQLKAIPELAHIPVIMLTMLEDQEIGYSLGAAEYLTKPISRHELINVLRKYRSSKTQNMVMIVEDDPLTREMMVRMLHKVGWQIIEAENGVIALEYLRQHHVDLVLLDLMMPEMDGFEFIIHLRQMPGYTSTPVVVLTAKDLSIEDRLWLNSRVDTVFQKGAYTREELLNELRQILVGAVSQPQNGGSDE